MTRPDGSTEMAACILVWCAEHGIATDSDYVVRWLDDYWARRFGVLDAEARVAQGVAPGVDGDRIRQTFPLVVCEPGSRCGDLSCPVCGSH